MECLPLSESPFPFGLTFVPSDVLGAVGGAAAATDDPALRLADASVALGASFAFVPASEPWAEAAVAALAERDVAPFWVVDGPLWPVVLEYGELAGLRATLTDPGLIGSGIDGRLEDVLDQIAVGARLGARAIVIAEDLAGSAGPLVAPDFAIAELLPRYARLVQAAGALGLCCVLHSDGDIRPLLPAIARASFVAVHAGGGLDFERFDKLFWSARAARLAVIGGLLTGELGHEIRAEAIGSTIGVIAEEGGLLVADDGGITTHEQMRGLIAALRAARSM
ncbi:MAG: hypothetical protein JW733_02690 [Coriobacteriia bacterium]|nr:hypothetical protein [Coriobacteriia bacterium]MBN2840346.1 hypothetical protein [Coriobacteriia bacterium]